MNARRWAFVISILWAAFFGAAFLLNLPPLSGAAPTGGVGLMVLAGGPLCLVSGALLAIWRERMAGALLWLGGAVAALGIAFQSGPYLGRYFLGMALIVLPQIVAGSLFLAHARQLAAKKPAPKR